MSRESRVAMGGVRNGMGVRKEKFRSRFPGWILQLSSGECAGIPQNLLLKNAVIPKGSAAHTHTHTCAPPPQL